MPTLIMSKFEGNLDGSIRAKTMAFLQKLGSDDTTPGLHIEPINGSADPRVRTGRVDKFWRAVLYRIDQNDERHYVVHGVWPHDEATKKARRTRLTVNPVNGLPQFEEVTFGAPVTAAPVTPPVAVPAPVAAAEPAVPLPVPPLVARGRTREQLVDVLGIPEAVAVRALAAADEDEVLALAQEHEGWIGLMLVDLTSADTVDDIVEKLELAKPTSTENDDDLIGSLRKPAARAQFAFVEGEEELRAVIEAGDFGAWRVFLHPEQRKWVDIRTSGPFRLSGGAGTGKTVVLVHRARRLARANPDARIVLTTFTTNLAESLRDSLQLLDSTVPLATQLGAPGVHVIGVDALASAVIRTAPNTERAVISVLGENRSAVSTRTPRGRWRNVLDSTTTGLPPALANEAFLASEYSLVVLPNRIRSRDEYLRVRRPGRGVALDRTKRSAVWDLVEAYRAQGRIDGSLDFAEAAAVAAIYLEQNPGRTPADHVLVDESQDLTPSHLQLLRALVAEGLDDLFLAEDSHQRIYGAKVVLGRYGIKIVGRSRRLTLNYRTTAENLRYAMSVLDGGDYVDLEDAPEEMGYRSARFGPEPEVGEVAGLDAELGRIVEVTKEWLGNGAAAETVAVLVPDRSQRDRVATRLAEAGVAARAVDRESPGTGRVLVMTMHRAKGMEFSKVVLADVGHRSPAEQSRLAVMDPSQRADVELRARSLLYVAATRARDELVVICRP